MKKGFRNAYGLMMAMSAFAGIGKPNYMPDPSSKPNLDNCANCGDEFDRNCSSKSFCSAECFHEKRGKK